MNAEANAICGAGLGERSAERVNQRNGCRARQWDTRMGSIDLAIPKLRHGTYYPGWLLEPRRRAEKALTAVVAEAYLLGVSTRKVEDLVQALGIEKLSKSQVSEFAIGTRREPEGVPRASARGQIQVPVDRRSLLEVPGERPHRKRRVPRSRGSEPGRPSRDPWP